MRTRLEGRSALVTGAAQGIGRAAALALARQGAHVGVLDRNEHGAAATAHAIEAAGGRAVVLVCDLRSRAICAAVVGRFVQHCGRLDVLVNAAVSAAPGTLIKDLDDTASDAAFDICYRAVLWLMQAAYPHMVSAGGGSVINFGSNAGTEGMAGNAAYAAAKEAVRGLTRTAAIEWGPEQVRVNVICPVANSPSLMHFAAEHPELLAAYESAIPLGRIGDCAADIAPVVVFLASDDSRYLTGVTLQVDGGSGKTR